MAGRPRRGTHGQYGYARREKCRCEPCLTVVRRYSKQLNLDKSRGRSRKLDPTPVRRHLQRLLDAGVDLRQIGHAAEPEVMHSVLLHIMYGKAGVPAKFVQQPTAERLLAVTYEQAAAIPRYVSPVGLRRRLQALEYMGHPKSAIAAELGVTESMVHVYHQSEMCLTTTVAAVHAVYMRLGMRRGSSARARWTAYRRGWLPPMAWDEETIDDPATEPDMSAVACIVENCTLAVFADLLCKKHRRAVFAADGFRDSRRFRETVQRLGKRLTYDRPRFVAEVSDLKEAGLTVEETAARLGRAEEYVAKVWSDVA